MILPWQGAQLAIHLTPGVLSWQPEMWALGREPIPETFRTGASGLKGLAFSLPRSCCEWGGFQGDSWEAKGSKMPGA